MNIKKIILLGLMIISLIIGCTNSSTEILELCDNVDYDRINKNPIYSEIDVEVFCDNNKENCLDYGNGTTYKNSKKKIITGYEDEPYVETICELNGAVVYKDEVIAFEDYFCRYCENNNMILCHHNKDGLGKYNNCKTQNGQTVWSLNLETNEIININSNNKKLVKKEIEIRNVKNTFNLVNNK